jgi:hypothetical protein
VYFIKTRPIVMLRSENLQCFCVLDLYIFVSLPRFLLHFLLYLKHFIKQDLHFMQLLSVLPVSFLRLSASLSLCRAHRHANFAFCFRASLKVKF